MPSHRVRTRPATGDAGADAVDSTREARAQVVEDAAHFPGGHTPGVAHPHSEAGVAAILRETPAVLPVGAQSSLTGGATPMGEIVIATDRLNRIVRVDSTEVTVQPGVPLAQLQSRLAESGARFPPAPTFDGAFAGGVVSTNAAGPATFKYGSTRDWVLGLSVMLADGSVLDLARGQVQAHADGYFEVVHGDEVRHIPIPTYRMPEVAKRSAGYFAEPEMDLVDLFVGSEGTLGVVTEVTLRVLPRAPAVCLLWVTLPTEASAVALVATLRAEAQATWAARDPRGVDIAAIEHLDRRSLELAREDGADRTSEVSLPADGTVALLAQVELPPEAVPSPEAAHAQIAGALDGSSPDTPLVRLSRLLAHAGVLDRAEIALPHERRRQRQLTALREAVPDAVNRRIGQAQRTVDPAIRKTAADMIVPFDGFNEIVQIFRAAFDRRGLDYAVWGHISDGNVHPNVLPRSLDDVRDGQAAILECGRAIITRGGCPLAEHGVGRNATKQALLRQLYGNQGIDEMRRVKRALDPTGKLSPGVLFGRST